MFWSQMIDSRKCVAVDLWGCIHDGASRVAYMFLILKAHSSSDTIMTVTLQVFNATVLDESLFAAGVTNSICLSGFKNS